MKVIFLLLLAGCATGRGVLHNSQPLYVSLIKCETGEPYYGSVTTVTDFNIMMQRIEVSWQCQENNGERKYIYLAPYHLSMYD